LKSFALETVFSNIDVRAGERFGCELQFADSQRKKTLRGVLGH
jgi:hypothetical protein